MEKLLYLLPPLACGVMMVVCMRMMGGRGHASAPSDSTAHDDELVSLRQQVDELQRQVDSEREGDPRG